MTSGLEPTPSFSQIADPNFRNRTLSTNSRKRFKSTEAPRNDDVVSEAYNRRHEIFGTISFMLCLTKIHYIHKSL